jgi:anion-transporting  ArsA/GET3 family ATPase
MATMSPLSQLSRRRLIVVTGKGGVGKTTVAAILGRILAGSGQKTLVIEVDPRENVHRLLGLDPSGGAIVSAGRNLSVQNLKPRQVLDGVVEERIKVGFLVRKVLESPIYHHFAEGAPGLKELAVLGHAYLLVQGRARGHPRFDVVVLDAPATGHGVALLAAPHLVSEVITSGPFSEMAGELARFMADPEQAGIVAVTQAEEMPVDEALDLRRALRERARRDPELLVINGLYPPLPPGVDDADPLVALWRHRREINDRELARLAAGWAGPRLELPQLALDPGPRLLAALERLVEEAPWS